MNPQQKRFAEEYLKDYNATRAAKRAGYSEKSAYTQGPRLLEKAEVKKYIEEQEQKKMDKAKKAADRKLPTIDEVYEFWASVMRSKTESPKDRLRASENIAKVQGAFVENVKMDMTAEVNQAVTISESDRALLENLERRLKDG